MYNLVFGGFAGVLVYAHVTDNLLLPHSTGVTAGLLAGVVVSALFWLYSMEYDSRDAELERLARKRPKR